MTTTRKVADIVTDLYTALYVADGATVPAVVGQRVPSTGYAVAINGILFPADIDFAEYERMDKFVTRNLAWAASTPNGYFGIWVDGDSAYLDRVLIISERAEAMIIAEQYGQLAIFDLAAQQEIRL